MLRYTITFLLIAILAAVLGFTSIAGASYFFAKILFFLFIILFVLSFFFGRNRPVDAL